MPDIQHKIKHLALYLLGLRDHSTQELTQKLQRKNYQLSDIAPVLIALQEAGYLSEQRFIETYIRSYRNKGYGPLRVQQQLRAKGISAELIAQHMQLSDNAWSDCARTVWLKYSKGKKAVDFKQKAKEMRFLHSRGFTREHIEPLFNTNDDWS